MSGGVAAKAGGEPDVRGYVRARIVANVPVAEQTWRLRLDCPEIAPHALPGQFAMLRIPDCHDPLLARAFAFYDVRAASSVGPASEADFVYLVHGKFTTALTRLREGDAIALWGPLGNGFDPAATQHLVLVAGGIGQTALLALARERAGIARYGVPPRARERVPRITFLWGARRAASFAAVDDFRGAGCDVHLATLDGSIGHRGTVVDLLAERLEEQATSGEAMHVACCGPNAMMAAVAAWCRRHGIGCSVSLEEPMACGVGICFTCVARVRDAAGGWDYRRTCVEGPVFPADAIAWDG